MILYQCLTRAANFKIIQFNFCEGTLSMLMSCLLAKLSSVFVKRTRKGITGQKLTHTFGSWLTVMATMSRVLCCPR